MIDWPLERSEARGAWVVCPQSQFITVGVRLGRKADCRSYQSTAVQASRACCKSGQPSLASSPKEELKHRLFMLDGGTIASVRTKQTCLCLLTWQECEEVIPVFCSENGLWLPCALAINYQYPYKCGGLTIVSQQTHKPRRNQTLQNRVGTWPTYGTQETAHSLSRDDRTEAECMNKMRFMRHLKWRDKHTWNVLHIQGTSQHHNATIKPRLCQCRMKLKMV